MKETLNNASQTRKFSKDLSVGSSLVLGQHLILYFQQFYYICIKIYVYNTIIVFYTLCICYMYKDKELPREETDYVFCKKNGGFIQIIDNEKENIYILFSMNLC